MCHLFLLQILSPVHHSELPLGLSQLCMAHVLVAALICKDACSAVMEWLRQGLANDFIAYIAGGMHKGCIHVDVL